MRIWLLSDLHFEVNGGGMGKRVRIPEADVCVLAGDIDSPPAAAVQWAALTIAPSMPVVYVCGNHEFYGGSIDERIERGRKAASRHPGVHFLENDAVVIDGVRFLGATLWSDFMLEGPAFRQLYEDAAAGLMLDYRIIFRLDGGFITTDDTLRHNGRAARWLDQQLSIVHDGPTVVVTHHAPHPRSISTRYEGSALNGAFVSDMSDLMLKPGAPDLWLHGHVHAAFDYRVGRTRIVCNPLGYLSRDDERMNGFVWDKIVEVEQ